MDFALPPLPYADDALEPHLGAETLRLHHRRHHAGYLEKLEELIGERPEAARPLEEIVRTSVGAVFDNAAQAWNHRFLWHSMAPGGGGEPRGPLGDALARDFGSFDSVRKRMLEDGSAHFGSGWLWLVVRAGSLEVVTTHDAGCPLRDGDVPLVTADLWEHAYYLDHRNDRRRYLETYLDHLIHWEFAAENFARASGRR